MALETALGLGRAGPGQAESGPGCCMAPRRSLGGKGAVNSVVGRLWCLPLGAAATGPNEELTEVHPSVRRNGARRRQGVGVER